MKEPNGSTPLHKYLFTDATPPVVSNGSPSGTLAAGTANTTLTVTTDENATCRYSTTAGKLRIQQWRIHLPRWEQRAIQQLTSPQRQSNPKIQLSTWYNNWGEVTINQAGVYGTKGVAGPSNVPGTREAPVSWADSSGNLWLFGG